MKKVNRSVILVIASMGIFVEALDIAIVNLAIPEIEKDLGLSSDSSYKLQSLYILTYGCFLILGGKLSDFFGRKKVFLWGTGIFLVTSLGAGLSHTFYSLLTFRTLQGLGAALLMPAAFSIVNYYFTEPHERSRAIAVFSSFAAIGSASGLSVGGIITSYLGWSWVFLINVPILVVVIAVVYFIMEKDTSINTGFPDIPSGIAIILAMFCLTWSTELLSEAAEHYLSILFCLGATVLLTRFVYGRLKTQEAPLLDIDVLLLPSLKKGNLLFLLLGALFTGYLFMMSFLVQKTFGFSAAKSGFIMMPFNLLSVIIARFVLPVVVKRISPAQIATAGNLAMLAGAICLAIAVPYHSLFFLLAGGTFIAGIGMTLCFTGYSVLSMDKVPTEHLGVAGSLTTAAYLVGGGMGLPLFTAFMDNIIGVTNSKPIFILLAIALLCLFVLNRKKRQVAI